MKTALGDDIWAILPSTLRQIAQYFAGDTTVRAAISRTPAQPRNQGVVAVVPIHGVIDRRSSLLAELFGGTSVDSIRASFRAALTDPDVKGIVLDVDSPGGYVSGIPELAGEIRAARGTKPIIALADGVAASAAYWLASQADELIATPSSQVGSVGVYSAHFDESGALEQVGVVATEITAGEFKAEESSLHPLTDEGRAAIQARTDAYYAMFVGAVADGRNVSAETVRNDYGKGRVLLAKDAQMAGMVDYVGTMEDALRRVARYSRAQGAAAEADLVEFDEPQPFRERVALLRADADAVISHATARAELRAKEGRPPLSDGVTAELRAIRDSIDQLLPGEPAAATPPAVEPPPAPPVQPAVIHRFSSDEEWLDHLKGVIQ